MVNVLLFRALVGNAVFTNSPKSDYRKGLFDNIKHTLSIVIALQYLLDLVIGDPIAFDGGHYSRFLPVPVAQIPVGCRRLCDEILGIWGECQADKLL